MLQLSSSTETVDDVLLLLRAHHLSATCAFFTSAATDDKVRGRHCFGTRSSAILPLEHAEFWSDAIALPAAGHAI
jgi:hypothetical protein